MEYKKGKIKWEKEKLMILMAVISLSFSLLLPSVFAEESYVFKQNNIITLEIPTLNNDLSKCTGCSCDITIDYPNGTNYVRADSISMTSNYILYTVPANKTDVLGVYKVDVHCSNGADFGMATFEYQITQTGSELTTAQGILYFIGLGLASIFFGLALFFSIKIPFKNSRNDDGRIISINKLKYLKLFMMAITYGLLLLIIGITNSIMTNFLFLSGISKIFNWLYWILLSLTYPAIVLIFIGILIFLFEDNILYKKIKRGGHYR